MGLLQDKLKDKERDLSDQLEQQKAILLAEKEKVENNLMEEMNRKMEEKDKELTTQLEAQRNRLENILQHKVGEQMRLQVKTVLQVKPVSIWSLLLQSCQGEQCGTVLPCL